MPYDENSFLQGVAVGRSLKGVSVISGGGGEARGKIKVAERDIAAVGIIFVSTEVPSSEGYDSINANGTLYIDTQYSRTSNPVVPAALGFSGIAAADTMTLEEVADTVSAEPDGTMGYTMAVTSVISFGSGE